VPFAAPAELHGVIAELVHHPIVLTPATSDCGTNALAMRAPDLMAPCFGKDSFERHRASARAHGLGLSIIRAAGLGHDIDRPRDLIFSADLGRTTQTAALLAELNVTARLTKSPLILSFSPRGEGTPELSPRKVQASSLPLGRETE
jgi:2-phospho-L-lactate guanylyltransferase